MKYVDEERFTLIGLDIKNRGKDILVGIFIGLIVLGGNIFLLMELNEVIFLKVNFDLLETLYICLVCLFVSFSEEILFRGYILKNFLKSMNSFMALILSALLFALIHSFNPNVDWFSFLALFLGGVLLGIPYIFTKNLWFSISLHFSWNFFQTLFGFNVSGINLYSLIEFNVLEKNMFNGGDFGFEGSILSIISQILLIFGIVLYYYQKKWYEKKI